MKSTEKLASKLDSQKSNIMQFLKYGTTGGLAFLLEYSSFYVLDSILKIWYVWSNSIAMILGFMVSFILNRRWSFKSNANPTRQLLMYSILFVINLGISNLLMLVFIEQLNIRSMVSKIITICILICWNFIIYKKVIFK